MAHQQHESKATEGLQEKIHSI